MEKQNSQDCFTEIRNVIRGLFRKDISRREFSRRLKEIHYKYLSNRTGLSSRAIKRMGEVPIYHRGPEFAELMLKGASHGTMDLLGRMIKERSDHLNVQAMKGEDISKEKEVMEEIESIENLMRAGNCDMDKAYEFIEATTDYGLKFIEIAREATELKGELK